jgi:hypothetical protein
MTTYREYYTRESKPSQMDIEFWQRMDTLDSNQISVYATAILHGATAEQAMAIALEPAEECACFLPEMNCPVCAPAHDIEEEIPFS